MCLANFLVFSGTTLYHFTALTHVQFYLDQKIFYTSTASAASDKYDLWPRPRPSSLLLVIYQNFPGLLGMVEGGMYQVCAEYSRPRAQPQVTEAPV